jgi:hypothetical protein
MQYSTPARNRVNGAPASIGRSSMVAQSGHGSEWQSTRAKTESFLGVRSATAYAE